MNLTSEARFMLIDGRTLEAFIQEAGLPEDAGAISPQAWTIEQILQEKIQFDSSVNFERQGSSSRQQWSLPAPEIPTESQVVNHANVLSTSGDPVSNQISFTTADRKWKMISASRPYTESAVVNDPGDSPILSTTFILERFILTTSMSGHLSIHSAETHTLIDRCRHHSKYVVQVSFYDNGNVWLVATAGWDQKIHVYALDPLPLENQLLSDGTDKARSHPGYLGEPVHTISLPSNPESLVFALHPDTKAIYLIASRRDSAYLHYFLVKDNGVEVTIQGSGRQNLAPHSNNWVAFTPCSLSLCPTDPTLLAVATSHIPHMKLIVVRLLFPSGEGNQVANPVQHRTQASLARAELDLQDREDAAISIQVSTMAPQTPYSTPQVVWRPDGSGMFVNGDDGVIRGIETTSGKVICFLRGHEAGSKVRTLWAGIANRDNNGKSQEILVSGGFDKKLLLWTTSNTTQPG